MSLPRAQHPASRAVGLSCLSLSLLAVLFQLVQLLPTLAYCVMYVQLYQPGLHPSTSTPLFLCLSPGDAGYCRPHKGLTRPSAHHWSICLQLPATAKRQHSSNRSDAWCLLFIFLFGVSLFDEKKKK